VLTRRQFLHAGTVALVVAACTKGKGGAKPGETTTTQPTTTSSGASPSDVALLKTAASLEALAVSVYQRAMRSELAEDAAVIDAMKTFESHHTVQLQTLNVLLTSAQITEVTAPNDALDREIFQPAIAAAKSQDDVIRTLFILEDVVAQTYVYAAPVAIKPEHRTALLSIGGVQARHRTVLGMVFAHQSTADLFPSAFAPSDNPLPPDAILS
jgi:hypothetical protein